MSEDGKLCSMASYRSQYINASRIEKTFQPEACRGNLARLQRTADASRSETNQVLTPREPCREQPFTELRFDFDRYLHRGRNPCVNVEIDIARLKGHH